MAQILQNNQHLLMCINFCRTWSPGMFTYFHCFPSLFILYSIFEYNFTIDPGIPLQGLNQGSNHRQAGDVHGLQISTAEPCAILRHSSWNGPRRPRPGTNEVGRGKGPKKKTSETALLRTHIYIYILYILYIIIYIYYIYIYIIYIYYILYIYIYINIWCSYDSRIEVMSQRMQSLVPW